MKNELAIYIFTDFDGTITKKDIGDEIFKEFGQFEPFHSELKNGNLTIEDYWNKVCSTLKVGVNKKTIEKYALECEIDPYFEKFANYCRGDNIPLTVISDGFDIYIHPILKNIGLQWLPVFCNKLLFDISEKTKPIFPYASESCNCFCASCKRNSVLANTPENSLIVFVGDGYSDYCAAEHADIIFAKKKLAAYCNSNKIPHYPFKTFFDVYRIMQDIITKKKMKQRNQALQLRKKAFEIE